MYQMVGVADRNDSDTMLAGPRDRFINGATRNHLTNTIVPIHDRDSTRIDFERCERMRLHRARLQPRVVPTQPQQTMRLMSP